MDCGLTCFVFVLRFDLIDCLLCVFADFVFVFRVVALLVVALRCVTFASLLWFVALIAFYYSVVLLYLIYFVLVFLFLFCLIVCVSVIYLLDVFGAFTT